MSSTTEFPTMIAKQSKYQPMVDALVDKSRSYDMNGDTSNIYRAGHYYSAAKMYAEADDNSRYNTKNIPNGICGKIGNFCYDFLKKNPPKDKQEQQEEKQEQQQQEQQPQQQPNWVDIVTGDNRTEVYAKGAMEEARKISATNAPIITMNESRRSARLASKPKKSYKVEDPYDSEDIPDDGEVDDDDEDYMPSRDEEESQVMRLFRKKTAKYGLSEEQLEQVVSTFEAYYEANKDGKQDTRIWYQEYDESTYRWKDWQMYKLSQTIGYYITDNKGSSHDAINENTQSYINPILKEAILNYTYSVRMKKEVEKMGLEYDEKLMSGFWKWYNDHVNKDKIQHRCMCSDDMCFYSPMPEIIRTYIKTIPKKFIF